MERQSQGNHIQQPILQRISDLDSPQKVGKKIKAIEKGLEEYDAIHHSEIPHGNASIEHVFESENPFEQGES